MPTFLWQQLISQYIIILLPMIIPPFLLENIIPVTVPFSPFSFNSWTGTFRSPESRRREFQKWSHFWSPFGLQNGSQNGPKSGPKFAKFWAYFWIPFCWSFGALSVPLGSLLGLPEALLGCLWTPKTLKKHLVFQGFCKCSFLGLWSSQWPSWAHLGPFLGRSGPQTVPKMAPKIVKRWSKKWSNKRPQKSDFSHALGPKMVPKNVQNLDPS